MNIKFGMDNFYVRYLKRFLNHELSESKTILGKFDKNDLSLLIKYLNLPNVADMFVVHKEIVKQFPELDTLFNIKLKDDVIKWTSRSISTEESEFLINNIDAIKDYCKSVGWELNNVVEWIDLSKDINNDGSIDRQDEQLLYDIIYNNKVYDDNIMRKADLNLDGVIDERDLTVLSKYLIEGKLSLEIKKSSRKNYFPNKDMLVFVNQFDGTFLYNYAIRDENGIGETDKPHYDTLEKHKIALYKCTPGQKVTIAHNSDRNVHLVIGSSPANLKQDLTNFFCQNVVEVDLRPGQGYQYTCSSKDDSTGYDAVWLCIQCPSDYGNITGTTEKTTLLEIGDINFDGQIDLQDSTILSQYTAEGDIEIIKKFPYNRYNWEPTPKQKMVMDINRDNDIDVEDAQILYKFIKKDPLYPSLGIVAYTYEAASEYESGNNVSNLLIIDGHYDSTVNIPFMDFVTDDWVIHDKFFNYLLGMAIHPYSVSEDITYLQKLLKEYYPEHSYDKLFFYPGDFNENMKKVLHDYQLSKSSYTLGDLNRDNKITKEDLQILRQYLDNTTVLTDEQKKLFDKDNSGIVTESDYEAFNKEKTILRYYLDKQMILTPEELEYYDFNKDGVVDEKDYVIIQEYLTTIRSYLDGLDSLSPIQRTRADVNIDGYIDEYDYKILEAEVNGETTSLRDFDIPFMLGWLDVQTESLLEADVNSFGNISEVSK